MCSNLQRFLLLVTTICSAEVVNFLDAGGIEGKDASTEDAFNNTRLLNSTLAALQTGDTLLIPNTTFMLMGGAYADGLDDVSIQLDGTFKLSDDIKKWPLQKNGHTPVIALQIFNSRRLTITSSGKGTFDGNGDKWWGVPGVGYLKRGKDRPPILSVTNATDFVLENILFLNSPRFNFISKSLNNATIRWCDVSARRTTDDSHSSIDLTAFNTDGFDVSGKNIHVHDCNIWNQDDTVAVKAQDETTENVLVERVNASGVGLTIGSIGAYAVRNVTFRDVYMHHTSKGIYIKFRASGVNGSITDVLYENVVIDEPESWPIWIGPQQAGWPMRQISPPVPIASATNTDQMLRISGIKEGTGPYNPCKGDPCSLCWPQDKSAGCTSPAGQLANITLRNITIKKPKSSPGVIYGNETNPIRGLVFDGVRFTDPPSDGAFGKDFFYCKGVSNAVAKGDTWPVPPCFENQTTGRR